MRHVLSTSPEPEPEDLEDDEEYLEVREHLRRHGYSSFWKWPGCGEAEHDTLASHVNARKD